MAAKPKTGTAVGATKIQLPADAAAQLAADVAALAGKLAAPSGKAIQVTQSKKFRMTLGDEQVEVDEFKGIILDFVSMNAYYEGDFDPKNIVPPNCFAIGTVKNDSLVSSGNSPDPQNDVGGACGDCWANQWKSAAKGNGKACKNTIKLAVLCADGEIRPLSISSTGLKAFGEYVGSVVQAFGVAPYGVMTTFSFDPKSDFSSVRCGNPLKLNDDQLALAFSRKADGHAMITTEPDTSEFEEKVVQAREKPKGRAAVGKPPVSKGKAVSRASAS